MTFYTNFLTAMLATLTRAALSSLCCLSRLDTHSVSFICAKFAIHIHATASIPLVSEIVMAGP